METKEFSVSNGVKTKYFISSIAIFFTIFGIVVFSNNAFAEEQGGVDDFNIKYPIAELGNCKSKEACGTYCDKPKNESACINFAEKNNMMSQTEIEVARNFIAAGSKGPGGCTSKDTCETYCNDVSRIDVCVSFAEKDNLMPPTELAEAKQVQSAISRGVKPPSCDNKKQCDSYCEEPDHMEECINFGAEAGFTQGKELEDAQKMLAAVKKGVKPPPCKGKDACDEYCSVPANMEVCMNFAAEAGFMNEEEKANSQKMLQAVKKGITPPKCKGKEECDVYCGQEEHFEECVSFSEAAGFMSSEDAAMARKTGGKGPGDCKGKEECDAFCKNPDNQETCFNFAKDNGMISEEELKKMEEGKARCAANPEECKNAGGFGSGGQGMGQGGGQGQNDFSCSPKGTAASFVCGKNGRNSNTGGPETTYFNACTAKQDGAEIIHEGVCEGHNPCSDVADPVCGNDGNTWVSACYADEQGGGVKYTGACKNQSGNGQGGQGQNSNQSNQQGQQGQTGQQGQAGPGGCKSPEECKAYCQSNPEVCQKFQPGSGQGSNQQGQQGSNEGQGFNSGSGQSGTGSGADQGQPEQSNQQGQQGQPGPGGCKSPEECKAYCQSHQEECQKFQPGPGVVNPGDQVMPQQSGPGGCKSPEECKTFCASNPEVCKNFSPGVPPQGQFPSQPPDGSTFTPPPQNSPGAYQQPPANMQYQDGQQQQPPPSFPGGNPPPPQPTSFNRNPLLAAISEIISWFWK